MKTTTLVEERVYKSAGGYLKISYHCKNCGHTVTFPEQQGFNYCYLCGARVKQIKARSLTWNPLSLSGL